MNHFYNKGLKTWARENRNSMTKGETLLWSLLKNRKTGVGFKRQRPIGPYIVDFYAAEIMLAIELDGFSHHFAAAKRVVVKRSRN